jgi:acyl-CoA synthetase (NDP forming)/GNAT superfamily N-acetyltransferase
VPLGSARSHRIHRPGIAVDDRHDELLDPGWRRSPDAGPPGSAHRAAQPASWNHVVKVKVDEVMRALSVDPGSLADYEEDPGVRAVLADGQVVLLRTLNPRDQDAVLGLHEDLDEHDRYFRFFGPLPQRVDDLVFAMTAPVSVHGGSMGAFLDNTLLGVAHYETLAESTRAEVALAVSGARQVHGVGTLLLEHLVSLARRHGVRQFVADVLTENARMLRVFHDSGLPCRMTHEYGVTQVELTLDDVETYLGAMAERERTADTASLRPLLRPASVVVVGAGRHEGSVGYAVLQNILTGGYTGQLYAVNPHTDAILGVPSFPTVADLPKSCELAVVCVPAAAVPEVAEQCGQRGARALVVISAGLTGDRELRDRLLAAIRRYGMRMVGPNCVGVATSDASTRLDATFAPSPMPAGAIGLVTQSGGIGIALREQLGQLGLGLSAMVSTGDKYDVSGNDLLMWWQRDDATRAVALYLESFGNPRKFGRLARALGHRKPVLAVRTGSSESAQRAAASHTAAAATPAVTRDALFCQAGVIVVDSPTELVDTLAALSWQPLPAGRRVAVVTNAGGAGVLAADACAQAGLVMADLAPATVATLHALLPAMASTHNPVDTTAAVDVDTFNRCVSAVLADPGVDAVVAATVRTAIGDPIVGLATVIEGDKPLLAVRLGQARTVAPLFGADCAPSTACYADPAAAIAVLGRLTEYAHWRDRPNPAATLPPDTDVPGALTVLREKFRADPAGGWLAPQEVDTLLRCFGIPIVDTRFAADEDAAVRAAAGLSGPVVVKADADGVLHKSSHGGVILDVRDENGVRATVRALADRFGTALRGVLVQPMADPGRELLVGVHSDGVFGPLVVFGLGGVDTDVVADRTARLAPLGGADADDLLHGLRASAALFGPAATPTLDAEVVRDVLLRVGLLAHLLPEVIELDLNPLVVGVQRCQALDARIRVAPAPVFDPFLPGLRG